MPNWCWNSITIYNPKVFKEKCMKDGRFSFDNVVPQPEHMRIKNRLHVDNWMEKQIGGSDHLKPEYIKNASKLQNEFFQRDVFDYISVKPWLDAETQRTEIPADGWYDWDCANWGTKWDVDDEDISYDDIDWAIENNTDVDFGFNTAWAPPIPIFERMAEMGIEFDVSCEEPGCEIYISGSSNGETFSYSYDDPPKEDEDEEDNA